MLNIIKILIIIFSSKLFLLVLFYLFWKFYFLRDPERLIPKGEDLVSPADGRIMLIQKFNSKNDSIIIKKKNFGKISTLLKDVSDEGYIISIFMSPFNVHINRSPIQGEVIYQKHFEGKFLFASNFKSIIQNEKNELIIQNKNVKIKVIQVAGFLARKIVSFVKENDKLEKGQRFGLINLGSQVNIIFPKTYKPNVKLNQKVKAGSTIIAKKL
jgi:phosphatidylserine decarboxylase